ncbi:hypothetical protein CMO93_05615 [Candidatus Woesearchaeota archaeon]|jgi:aspartate aminotransferase|nr:hypothetical protein [Candidatus Woesearchaeota archaeon]|tara:strand:+ start:14276 stop:14521 length:246 start_codon:yes stop_codon:yes gene_type:complete
MNFSERINSVKESETLKFTPIIEKLRKEGKEIIDFAAYILEDANVAVVSGSAFGDDNHIRISYAIPESEIKKGFENMAEVL